MKNQIDNKINKNLMDKDKDKEIDSLNEKINSQNDILKKIYYILILN